jgi:TorA maturation chaperone TorD
MNASSCENKSDNNEQLFTAYSVIFYFTGSIITLEPDIDGLPEFCSTGLLRNLPVSSRNPDFEAAFKLFNAPCEEPESCSCNVADNFRKLFADKDLSNSWPAESSWPSEKNEMMTRIHGSVDYFYQKYSFHPDNDRNLPPDHLGIELLFFNKLISLYLHAGDREQKDNVRKDIIGFSESHLLNWLQSWVKSVTENSDTKCFKGIAHLILASVEDVKSLLLTDIRN